jgi:hypothetical protein
MNSHNDVPGLADVEVTELQKAVDDFAIKLTRTEFHRCRRMGKQWASTGLHYLTRIFTARRSTQIPQIQAGNIGSVRSDGHNIAMNGTSSIVVKFENTLTRNTAPPEVELVALRI